MLLRLVSLIVAALPILFQPRAQELLTLCTEEALRTVAAQGGTYQIGCSTSLVSISLTRPLIIERDLSLVSTQEVILTGGNNTRLIIVRPGVRLTLDRILLFSGRQTPTNQFTGGIDDTAGAGIFNDGGIVTILNGRFEAHTVIGVTGAPGAAGSGDHGEPGGDAAGAAIYNSGGQITISNTIFTANAVTPGPGGAGGTGNTTFAGHGGDGGNGGSAAGAAIYSSGGSVTVLASIFTNNVAAGAAAGAGGAASGFLGFPGIPGEAGDGVGAAITGADAELIISGSTFVTNSVRGANGLSGNAGLRNLEGDRGRNGGEGAGGAVYSTGRLSITNSTFFGNVATGGNGGAGGAGGTGGFGGNGGEGGDGGTGSGAAVESTGPTTIIHCTFSDNESAGGNGGAGGTGAGLGETGPEGTAGGALGGAVHGAGAEVVLANSILAHSSPSVTGTISDRGGNLSTDLNPLISSAASLRFVNPFLRPLASNGGPTPTMELQTNSPAINAAVAEFCATMDQRGTNRIDCDIGAFEVYTPDPNLPPIPQNVLANGFTLTHTNKNLLQLSWPTGYTNLFVQFKTNLLMTNWTTLTNVPFVTNSGSFVLAVDLTNTTRRHAFFRLIGITNLTNLNLLFPPAVTNDIPGPPSPF